MIKIATPRFLAKLLYDKESINPRSNKERSQMVCWCDKYNLGDKHTYTSEQELLVPFMKKCGLETEEMNMDDFENQKENILSTLIKKMFILPLYLYDSKFPEMSCVKELLGKQGELVGYLFFDPESNVELYGNDQMKDRADALLDLINEMDQYSYYISGNNYLLHIYRNDGTLCFEKRLTGIVNSTMLDKLKVSAQYAMEKEKATAQEIDDMFDSIEHAYKNDTHTLPFDLNYDKATNDEKFRHEAIEQVRNIVPNSSFRTTMGWLEFFREYNIRQGEKSIETDSMYEDFVSMLEHIREQSGTEILQQIYDFGSNPDIKQWDICVDSFVVIAEYLGNGGDISEVDEMAQSGYFLQSYEDLQKQLEQGEPFGISVN